MVPRNLAVTVGVQPAWCKRAKEFASQSTGQTFDRFLYKDNVRVAKVYVGKLGEEILRSYLIEQGLQVGEVDYNVYPGTTAIDETDLKVGSCLIDVKVGTQDFHKRLLVQRQ